MDPPSWKSLSKKFPNRNGLIVQLGELEELNASGKGGCAQKMPIMVLLQERSLCLERTTDEEAYSARGCAPCL
jgi:hypothetical protein